MADANLTWATTAVGVVGVVAYVLAGWLYLGSGLVMPYPWAFGMWVLWAGGWAALLRLFRHHRLWTPLAGVFAVILWVVIVQLGSWLFGWTA